MQVVQYAKGKSFAAAKDDGSFNDLKRKRDEEKGHFSFFIFHFFFFFFEFFF